MPLNRLVKFLPALFAVLVGALGIALGEHNLLIRFGGLAAIMVGVVLVRRIQNTERARLLGNARNLAPARMKLSVVLAIFTTAILLIVGAFIFFGARYELSNNAMNFVYVGVGIVGVLISGFISYLASRRK